MLKLNWCDSDSIGLSKAMRQCKWLNLVDNLRTLEVMSPDDGILIWFATNQMGMSGDIWVVLRHVSGVSGIPVLTFWSRSIFLAQPWNPQLFYLVFFTFSNLIPLNLSVAQCSLFIGPRSPGPIYVSGLSHSLSELRCWNFTDVTLADEDTNWIPADNDKTLPEAQRTQALLL